MKAYSYARYSSPEQAKGTTKQRQIERAINFAKEKGWQLDETTMMLDEGLSAYHGDHLEKGALGLFLEDVKSGRIETPCALIVENLDRLSRASVTKALPLFMNIINAGITLVTLSDMRTYTVDGINDNSGELLISIFIMARANEESKIKQDRMIRTWEIERKKAAENGEPVKGGQCPSWLKRTNNSSGFMVLPERAAVVKRIYDMYLAGHGVPAILKTLNSERIKPFSKKNRGGWGTTSVRKLLSHRAVIGEMQFMRSVKGENGKRTEEPVEDPIPKYYPAIIDEDTFFRTQAEIEKRFVAYGKVGLASNLFQSLAKCGYCGATMQYAVRGRSNTKYLACKTCRTGRADDCVGHIISFAYQPVEDLFLESCPKLDLREIITHDTTEAQRKIAALQVERSTVEGHIAESERKVERFTAVIADTPHEDPLIKDHFVPLIRQEKKLQKVYTVRLTEIDRRISQFQSEYADTERSLHLVRETIREIQGAIGEKRTQYRIRLQQAIRGLVERIDFYPGGRKYKIAHDALSSGQEFSEANLARFMMLAGRNPKTGEPASNNNYAKLYRACIIHFKAGGTLFFANDIETHELYISGEMGDDGNRTPRSLADYNKTTLNHYLRNELLSKYHKLLGYDPEQEDRELYGDIAPVTKA